MYRSTLIYMFKNCHQHCYGFEILMSSWGVGILFSKLLWGNVFLKNHVVMGRDGTVNKSVLQFSSYFVGI